MDSDSSFSPGDIHARVTQYIVDAIEAGVGDFQMPWHHATPMGLPQNAVTQATYQGVNVLTLWIAANREGFRSSRWATYRQWQSIGAHVRKSEKATPILFFKERVSESPDDSASSISPKSNSRRIAVVKGSFVFNADQVDGWKEQLLSVTDGTRRLEPVEGLLNAIGADVQHGGVVACYNRKRDQIHMPERGHFIGSATRDVTEAYYSVLLHEHVHWSGHVKRLARDLSGRFGSGAYAMEELVAELGAAFLCAELGISVEPRLDHAAYVSSWLTVLKEQKRAIVTAAAAASAASKYLMNKNCAPA